MSKLVELLENTALYTRLNKLPGPNTPGSKEFSVRNQSGGKDANQETIGKNAVDFFSNSYQTGFNVFKQTLSTTGFQKAPDAQTSDYTGNPLGTATTENNAFDSYNRFATDGFRNKYNSKLVHKYLATNSTSQYRTINEQTAGVKLVYNPA